MDPLTTNTVDPALMRVLEKRGHERDSKPSRKRPPMSKPNNENDERELDQDSPKHEVDYLV